jgi:electron transfer flavoprotein-quinone oxidoreductase
VVKLPRETIEARFNLTGDEGAAIAAVGDCTQGAGSASSSAKDNPPRRS